MTQCKRHEEQDARADAASRTCSDCYSESAQAERDARHEAHETARFRDRCALAFAMRLLPEVNIDPSAVAIEAYQLADAMLGARSVR